MLRNVLILLLALCDQLGSFRRRAGKAQGAALFRGEPGTQILQHKGCLFWTGDEVLEVCRG
jgi:hypothetical protein